jgi:hypothetical protein
VIRTHSEELFSPPPRADAQTPLKPLVMNFFMRASSMFVASLDVAQLAPRKAHQFFYVFGSSLFTHHTHRKPELFVLLSERSNMLLLMLLLGFRSFLVIFMSLNIQAES